VTRAPLSRSKGQRSRSPGRFTHRGLNASGSCSGEHGNVLGVGNYCYVAVCSAALGASAPTEGGEGRGRIVTAARLQLVSTALKACFLSVGNVCNVFNKLSRGLPLCQF